MYKLNGVSKQFESKHRVVKAVKNVNLEIRKNEVFGIIGSSGAGKSTLVRCLNLLEIPNAGEVIFNGTDLLKLNMEQLNEQRKKIGMIFQDFNLFNSRTVYENVAFPLKGEDKLTIKTRVSELLTLVGLEDKVNSYPSQLSGGQKQRVAIARALANNPEVLLCDEATSALDPHSTQSILDLLKELNEKINLTIILITHEMDVIKKICDRVAIMSDGEVIEVDDVVKVFIDPQHEISKNFVLQSYNFEEVRQLVRQGSTPYNNFELVYGNDSTSEAIISSIIKQFGVEVNIISGYIEVVNKQTIGRLIVHIDGTSDQISSCKEYLVQSGVRVYEFK